VGCKENAAKSGAVKGGKTSSEPLALARKIFGPDPMPDLTRYATGEYDGDPNGQDLKNAKLSFRVLDEKDSLALINMTVIDSTGQGEDWYLRFVKDTVWKLESIRSLAMTGIMQAELEELEQMPQGYLDTLIAAAQQDKQGNALKMLTSMDDYHFLIGNLKLALALDDTIVDHFQKNKAAFEKLKDAALKEIAPREGKKHTGAMRILRKFSKECKAVLVEHVHANEFGRLNCITFTIGGMIDNFVGYLYVKDKKDLPDVYNSGLIMLREIGEGWYLFKTT
jgi:hypothetical protein